MLENQTGFREQLSKEQLFRLDIKHVSLVSTRRVRNSFVSNQQVRFDVPAALTFNSLGVASFFKDRFVYVLTQ